MTLLHGTSDYDVSMQQSHVAFLQRQVAISVGTASMVLSLISYLRRVLFFSDSLVAALLHPAISLVLVVGLIFVLATIKPGQFGRAVQVGVGLAVGCATALVAESGDLTSSVFLGLGLMLASEYGFLGSRNKWLFAVPLLLYVVAFGYGIYRFTQAILATVHTIMGAALIAYLFVAIVRARLKDQRDREQILEATVAERTEGLRSEVQRRAKLEQTLRESAEESQRLATDRALLLHELHHRTKNDLQLLASMIRLQSEDEPSSNPQDMFRAAEDRIMAIALVHEYLYASREFSAIRLDEYLDGLVTHLRAASVGSGIAITDTISTSVAVGIEPAIHIGLAINELVQNARKHAFPGEQQGAVEIAVQQDGDSLLVSVADDGVGMGAAEERAADGRSVGIEIVQSLVAQLGGSLELVAAESTRWDFRLSISRLLPKVPHRVATVTPATSQSLPPRKGRDFARRSLR